MRLAEGPDGGIAAVVASLRARFKRFWAKEVPPGKAPAEPRIIALDGLRGLMTIMVVVSHYFAEVPAGIKGFSFGWIAVIMFFVLSGYLVGRLIIEKKDRANFVFVFYVRRVCRTLPVYFVCVVLVYLLIALVGEKAWLEAGTVFPLWSYLTFTQNFFMVSTGSIGQHWLAPTWTLTVEEHFYLLAPAVFFFVPRRYLIPVFMGVIGSTLLFRYAVFEEHLLPRMAALALMPGVADGLVAGLIAAILIKTDGIDWRRYDLALRVAPLGLLIAAGGLKVLDGDTGTSFDIFAAFFIAVACAMYILAIVRGAPEAKRLEGRFYRFWGNNSYSIYLTHLAVLGLMHGLILGTQPDVASSAQIAVTLAALPVCALVGFVLTKLVEEPITSYGRSFRWSEARREPRAAAAPPVAAKFVNPHRALTECT